MILGLSKGQFAFMAVLTTLVVFCTVTSILIYSQQIGGSSEDGEKGEKDEIADSVASIEALVDQDVRTVGSPSFEGLSLDESVNATLMIKRSGDVKWTLENSPAREDALVIRRFGADAAMIFNGTESIQIGDNSTSWQIPQARGLAGQVLMSDSNGVCSWSDTPDQDLNTTDAVEFSALTVDNWQLTNDSNLFLTALGGQTYFNNVGGVMSVSKFSDSFEPQITFRRSRGTQAAQTVVNVNDALGRLYFVGNDSVQNSRQGALIQVSTDENWTSTAWGTHMVFLTVNTGTVVLREKLRLDTSGVRINNQYTMPLLKGTAGQSLHDTLGNGNLSWSTGKLSTLSDVVLTSLQDDDVLTYDLALNHWYNKQPTPHNEKSGKYSQSAVVQVLGSDGAKSIFDTTLAQGSIIIPANSIKNADIYTISASCLFENDSKDSGFVPRVYIGGVLLSTGPQTKMKDTSAPRVAEINVQVKYFGIGNAFNTTIDTSYVDDSDTTEREIVTMTVGGGVDVALDNAIDITAQWGTASAGQKLFIRTLTITKLII
jgi:hypothetical protein